MAEIYFYFRGWPYSILSNEDAKMSDIFKVYIKEYLSLNFKDINFQQLKFIYENKEIDENLCFKDIANNFDKERKKLDLLVYIRNNIIINDEKELEKYKDEEDSIIIQYK